VNARIFLLPTSAERVGQAAQRFQRMGYVFNSTRRGRIEAVKRRPSKVQEIFDWLLPEEKRS
jgi:hypothetical protein